MKDCPWYFVKKLGLLVFPEMKEFQTISFLYFFSNRKCLLWTLISFEDFYPTIELLQNLRLERNANYLPWIHFDFSPLFCLLKITWDLGYFWQGFWGLVCQKRKQNYWSGEKQTDYKWYLAWNRCENKEQENGSLVAVFQESIQLNMRITRKKGPLLFIYVVNVKGFRTWGMSFTCSYAHMTSYYCTTNFLPFPGWRKLFSISSLPSDTCGSSKGELTPWSHSLILHITSMLTSPWIRARVCDPKNLRSREGNMNGTKRVRGHSWTKTHSAKNLSSCSQVPYGNTTDKDRYR